MKVDEFEKIKKLAIVAMVSDDELMEKLVLKGGNAIDLIYGVSGRASFDIDFSMASEFTSGKLASISDKVEKALQETFGREGFRVFDFTFEEQPPLLDKIHKKFWGGYVIYFKLIPESVYKQKSSDIEDLRKNATLVGLGAKRKFKIEISKYEFCDGKAVKEIDGFKIYVYTPEMIVLEKARAICQQVPEYRKIVKRHPPSERARDFFDIYLLMKQFKINLNKSSTKDLLIEIFKAKKVPVDFLKKIRDCRESHRQGFPAVIATVKTGLPIKEFDFYFNYAVTELESLKF